MYLLRNYPHAVGDIVPCEFPENIVETIGATIREVRNTWDSHDNSVIRNSWDVWYDSFAPKSNNADDYIVQLRNKR